MVAILDTWEQPVYLTRIWTVYEQFVASTLEIEVLFVMPETAKELLQQQIARGHDGISEVTQAISKVDSARASAWKPEDEAKVKSMIQETVGFAHVDAHVTDVMVTWIGSVMQKICQDMISIARIATTAATEDGRQSIDANVPTLSLHNEDVFSVWIQGVGAALGGWKVFDDKAKSTRYQPFFDLDASGGFNAMLPKVQWFYKDSRHKDDFQSSMIYDIYEWVFGQEEGVKWFLIDFSRSE